MFPFSGIDVAPKTFVIVGGPITVSEAFEVFPVPPLVDVTWTLLFSTPVAVPFTFTETVQEPPGARLAPDRDTDEDAVAPETVPLHVELKPLGVATTSPAGRLSVKATPFKVKFVLELLKVKIRLVVPFSGTEVAPKLLLMCGGLITVSVAVDVFPLPAAVESMVTLLL